ncbi:lysine-rich arabinogalactan protein 19-like isoform X2 [Capsicum chacoense]
MPPSPAKSLCRCLFLLLHTYRQLLPQASPASALMASPLPSYPTPTNSTTSGAAIDGDGQPSLHAAAPSSVLQSASFSPLANVQQPRHSLDSSPTAIPPANPFGVPTMQPFLIENEESIFRFDPMFEICV